MTPLQMLASQPGVPRLAWTLLHFLWQGLAIAAVYAAARRCAQTSAPNVRYLLGCAALAVMAVAPLATWLLLGPSVTGSAAALQAAPLIAAASGAAGRVTSAFPGGVSVGAAGTPFLSWVVAVWLAGAAALWARLIGGWVLAVRLRTRLAHPAPAAWQQTLERLKVRVGVSAPVRLLQSPLLEAPAVVGWLRPVVLAPLGAFTGLPADQMEALLLHELAHIRRYDYLVNMLQSAVEALLFYHPAVWWVSGHMRAEREFCCDDATVSATGDALAYARALAELGLRRPPVVMASNGGALSHRIGRLLGKPRPAPRSLPAAGIVAAAVLPAVACFALFGQPAARPRFEVASIKLAGNPGPQTMRPLPNGLEATASLKLLIEHAYGVQSFQISGGPDWIGSERYAVEAKAAGHVGRQQLPLFLQSLLEERFQLKIHRETRQLPVFDLVQAKGGLKLPSPKEGGCADSAEPIPEVTGGRMAVPVARQQPVSRCGGLNVTMETTGARMFGGNVDMPELARMLSVVLDRKVIDKTGFAGTFDVRLDFEADDSTPLLPAPPPGAPPSMSPTISSALPEQLGLRLETSKGPVEVIVIDSAERPSAN